MDVKTEICDGYLVTLVNGKVFSVKPLPSTNSKTETETDKVDFQASKFLGDILENVKKTQEEMERKRERFRKAWGYGSHWFKGN